MSRLVVRRLPPETLTELCNSGDSLHEALQAGEKLVWWVRHGQSEANVALQVAMEAKEAGGELDLTDYRTGARFVDTPVSAHGLEQLEGLATKVATWKVKPSLIVVSPLTRALQTAAVGFNKELADGTARLIVRPELREYFPDATEQCGRQLSELRACPKLRALARWEQVSAALSDEATAEWRESWDKTWAAGADGQWQRHCSDAERMQALGAWLATVPDTCVATVSHWGTVNNFLNRQPWTKGIKGTPLPEHWLGHEAFPEGGLAKQFDLPNAGWVAVVMSPEE